MGVKRAVDQEVTTTIPAIKKAKKSKTAKVTQDKEASEEVSAEVAKEAVPATVNEAVTEAVPEVTQSETNTTATTTSSANEVEQENTPLTAPATPAKKKKEKKDKDPNAPKRPNTPYILFSNSVRAQLARDNPGLSPNELTALIGKCWGQLSAEEKAPFEAEYKRSIEVYNPQMEAYKAKLASEVTSKQN